MPRNIESAEPQAKARFREALAGAGEGAEVTLEIDGGPPSERYHYRVTLAVDGAGEHEFVSELKKIDRKPVTFSAIGNGPCQLKLLSRK